MRLTILAFSIPLFSTFGQTNPTIVGWGYHFQAPTIAAGQIFRLEVSGLNAISPSIQKATSVPLPNTIAGIAVKINQSIQQSIMGTATHVSYQAPLLSLDQENLCEDGTTPDCLATFITLQAPYELQTSPTSPPIIQSQIVIYQNGVASQAFRVGVVSDQIHIVTSCEDQPWQTGCSVVVTHVDGTVVSAKNPGIPGETIVIYAWGLGSTTGRPTTGDVSPTPAPVVSLPGYSNGLLLAFDFHPNAPASRYFPVTLSVPAYLTPGSVGLYQVNVTLPSTFPQVPACGGGVTSNLTINLAGPFSFDGAPICVDGTK